MKVILTSIDDQIFIIIIIVITCCFYNRDVLISHDHNFRDILKKEIHLYTYVPRARGVNAFAKILQSRHVNYRGRDGNEHAHQRAHHSHGTADFHLEKL